MSTGTKRTLVALVLLVASTTATSGATYTASSQNAQAVTAASDFGVHVSLDAVASPLRDTVSLQATASETAGGTITQVVIQRSPAGANAWTDVCVDGDGAPYTCSWNTTGVADGDYDLRARATNNSGYSRESVVIADRRVDNADPSVIIDDPGAWFGGPTTLSASASDTGGSGLATVRYEYKLSSNSTWTTACTGASAPWSCSFDATPLTAGASYDFRAIATDGAGNETTSAAVLNRRVDGSDPSGSLADPGAYLAGTRTLTGSASDTGSGVATVVVERSPAGTASWSTACVDSTTPFTSCDWATGTVTDGLYDLRAVITDVAGNTFTTATTANRRVDNTAPLTTLTAPAGPLSGTVSLSATGTDTGGSGVADVTFQRSATGAGSWTDLCAADPTDAYTCSWNSAAVPDAVYDLRSVARDNAQNSGYSTPVETRRVDNFVPSAVDVQTANGGATPGVIEAGDTITLTYSEQINPSSIIAGWDGTGSQNIYIGGTHHNQGDRLLFHSVVSPYPTIPLATSPGLNTEGDYFPTSGANFAATLRQSGASFTITIGALVGGSVNATAPPAATMRWYPSGGATDFVGKAASTTWRDESGAADREF